MTPPTLAHALLLALSLACLSAGAEPVKVKVIFDTDMANDCDDAGALAVLHALADLGEAEIVSHARETNGPG